MHMEVHDDTGKTEMVAKRFSADRSAQRIDRSFRAVKGALLALALAALAAPPLAAQEAAGGAGEVRYVTDRLSITLRAGKGTGFRILRMLPSGARVTVLETDPESGWSRVRLESGLEGWVLTRYLMREPSARERLARAEAQAAKARERAAALEAEVRRLKAERDAARREAAAQRARAEKAERELARIRRLSAESLRLAESHERMRRQVLDLERELRLALEENDALRDRTARDWFMAGAGVLLAGIVVGLVLPRIRWRRRSSWDSF